MGSVVIHISNPEAYGALCNALMRPGDKLVLAALQSDCDECREKVMVIPTKERGGAVKPEPTWAPVPWDQRGRR